MTNYTQLVENSDDAAKQYGNLETWNGEDVWVLRNGKGHFVTWRKADSEAQAAPVAVADGGEDRIEFAGVMLAEGDVVNARYVETQLDTEREVEGAKIESIMFESGRLMPTTLVFEDSDLFRCAEDKVVEIERVN